MHVHWHRRDLRAADNRGLAAAADSGGDSGGVLPVFVFDDAVLDHAGPPRVAALLDALATLRAWYRERDGDLFVARGDPREVIPALAREHDAEEVTWNRDYSGLARARDEAVGAALADAGFDHRAFHDAVLHPPGTIRTSDGEPYSVYSYYWKKWREREADDPVDAPDADTLVAPDADALVAVEDEGNEDEERDPLPTLDDLGFDEPEADVPETGIDAARDRLEAFCEGDIYRYAKDRDYPARRCTSRLSRALKFGTVGIREVHERVVTAREAAESDRERESGEEFRSQLAWREFYAQVLRYNPEVVTENYRSYERPIEWRDDPDGLQAWKDGETGYPIVDAGMRQLRAEAWMHNRVRMLVASFLTKDLLVDWREGYAWFREKLADHDTANDTGGWQWAASTGTDAQPYFRVFNPMTQGERYDPDAEYVGEYVPELRDADPAQIHAWDELSDEERAAVAPDYPAPIVDHADRREAALAAFERARGGDDRASTFNSRRRDT